MAAGTHDFAVEHQIAADPAHCFDGFIAMYGADRPEWISDSDIDLRVGGSWSVRFQPPGVEPFREERVITVLDRPDRLAYDMTALTHEGRARFATDVVLAFRPTAAGTTVRLEQSGFPDVADRDEFAANWPGVLILLAKRIED